MIVTVRYRLSIIVVTKSNEFIQTLLATVTEDSGHSFPGSYKKDDFICFPFWTSFNSARTVMARSIGRYRNNIAQIIVLKWGLPLEMFPETSFTCFLPKLGVALWDASVK